MLNVCFSFYMSSVYYYYVHEGYLFLHINFITCFIAEFLLFQLLLLLCVVFKKFYYIIWKQINFSVSNSYSSSCFLQYLQNNFK